MAWQPKSACHCAQTDVAGGRREGSRGFNHGCADRTPGVDLVLLTGCPRVLAHAASAGGHPVRPSSSAIGGPISLLLELGAGTPADPRRKTAPGRGGITPGERDHSRGGSPAPLPEGGQAAGAQVGQRLDTWQRFAQDCVSHGGGGRPRAVCLATVCAPHERAPPSLPLGTVARAWGLDASGRRDGPPRQ